MKITIRKNVWETNSSSVHAIAVPKKNIDLDETGNFGSFVYFNHGEFGWEHAVYGDVNSKASYLYQAIFECKCPYMSPVKYQQYKKQAMTDEEFKKYKESVKKFNKEQKEFTNILNWIYETLAKCGVEAVFDTDDYDEEGWRNGYIDHGYEVSPLLDYVLYNEKHLMTYLFGNTEICTSNDNDDMDELDEFIKDHPEKDYKIIVKGN